MPIPSSINDLDTNPNNNSPQGSETVGPNANGYIQALSAFIKQIATGAGWKPTATVDMNAQKITNIAQGTISPTSKDAVRGDQLYKIGEVRMYHGAVANIASVWGPGWQLCDGTNGTANLTDKFVVGAGNTYAPNATGGNASITLNANQLPTHNHGINDPGHIHAATISDPGHSHVVNDPGHIHGYTMNNNATGNGSYAAGSDNTNPYQGFTQGNQTGITLNNSATGVIATISTAFTGISTQNAGSGSSVDIRPPYYAMCFIEYTGSA